MASDQSTDRGRTTSGRGRVSRRGRPIIGDAACLHSHATSSSPSSVNSIQPTSQYHPTLSSPNHFTANMLTEASPPPSPHIPHAPSTQSPPLDTQGASGSSSQNTGIMPPQNNRILIRPVSTALFDPFDVTRKISEIMKTKYERAVTQWSDFTPEEKESYFKEFKSKFTWDLAHDVAIKKLWNKKSGELFRGMMHRARENPAKAIWIPSTVLSELRCIWDGPEYKKKREQGKKNRASEDSCSHTGGSIPHTEYRKRMKVELGRDPTKAEVFVRTHRKKSTQQLVDGRATTTIENLTSSRRTF
ncbi:uncharacterized protein LOC120000510 isoform X1 [Tripterygium wilfordii]|uniref:uncharacterized protein LOC120000510 isoform X1 n=1 Tax=Tripterygium wilfordii TaxID=458696 RepID=UPI0018F82327|nr:uncharacterized protein LOC120000510 isoform X1 [Tripterygium wilfordii]XP_038704539.1 uncharacterized protein LOC120000510 isoform X1 [Tripterygium wilfordii]XP_038704540.1 uncharacterized protein LOC120000510 isoform X1 [Tripterygium wilfordii]XP_038704541.1 uncharacterized protein LOC120000510 isoform X1 [Tripterygium wilfordii]